MGAFCSMSVIPGSEVSYDIDFHSFVRCPTGAEKFTK
jgi:hypothetical protein